jgi:hypothetical protein
MAAAKLAPIAASAQYHARCFVRGDLRMMSPARQQVLLAKSQGLASSARCSGPARMRTNIGVLPQNNFGYSVE